MKEREGVVNINFFKKIWYSITNFEKYPAMATEGLGRALKYLIGLTAIISMFLLDLFSYFYTQITNLKQTAKHQIYNKCL